MDQTRNWCFTLNNPTEAEASLFANSDYKYFIIGKEVGESGTPHFQGYIIFKTNKRLSAVKKISERAHWEPRRGTHEEARDYCKKDGDFQQAGEEPLSSTDKGQGEKRRWEEAFQLAKEGRIDEVPGDIALRCYRTLKEIAKDHLSLPPSIDLLENEWHWGASGTGKSRGVRTRYPDAYLKMANKWWDGYQGQDVVIIEDLDTNHTVLGHHLKIWADHYPFLAETKGGAIAIRPKKIIVTSNYAIDDIFKERENSEPLHRRFKGHHYNKI